MVGVERHAAAGIDPALSQQVTTSMLQVLKIPAPQGQNCDDGRAWLQAQAAEVLGRMKSVGQHGEVANALAALAADGKECFLPLPPPRR